jgi:hypothetical protein
MESFLRNSFKLFKKLKPFKSFWIDFEITI